MKASTTPLGAMTECGPLRAAHDFIQQLKQNCHVLIAVSGGGDSIGLLVALDEARFFLGRHDVRLSAATVDHNLRPESATEAAWVNGFCRDRGIDHETLPWTGDKPKTGLMAAARNARYGLLSKKAQQCHADVIAIAHTQQDQAETFEMRGKRGASTLVTGMADKTLIEAQHWITRPFLGVSRIAIREFLEVRNVGWFDDPSNDDAHYERVRTRKALQGKVSQLAQKAEKAAENRAELSRTAARLFDACATIHGALVAELDANGLSRADNAGRYLLNILISVLGGLPYGPGSEALDDVMALCAAPHGSRMTVGRCLFEKHRSHVFILREDRSLPETAVLPGYSAVWDGRCLFENQSDQAITVRAAGDGGERVGQFKVLPARLSRLAEATRPVIDGVCDDPVSRTQPYLAPFDRFLPGFDLQLANTIALAFARKAYPQPNETYIR